jgi:adenine-specific DNA glycosylase
VAKSAGMPKKKCCEDRPRCKRCPLRALAEGTLPTGYTVKKRRLVKVEKAGKVLGKSTRKAA